MTNEQEKHIKDIIQRFGELAYSKYEKGQIEHSGNLWEKPGMLDMALEELIDGFVYIQTAKDQAFGSRNGKKLICVDVDGVLAEGESWTEEESLKAEPRQAIIDKINELYKTNFICIYTARKDELLLATKKWLTNNGVKYHAFSNNKLGCDQYIDDKGIRPEEL